MRRFSPALDTTRKRSGTGLKSTPKDVPASAVNGAVMSPASAVSVEAGSAIAVVVSIVYSLPFCVRPYSTPVAGRKSIPTNCSPMPKPVTLPIVDTLPGASAGKLASTSAPLVPISANSVGVAGAVIVVGIARPLIEPVAPMPPMRVARAVENAEVTSTLYKPAIPPTVSTA